MYANLCATNQYMHVHTAICEDLTLANGVVTYNPSTTPRLEDTVATHTCNTGYTLEGASIRTCQSDRQWSLTAPSCNGEMLLAI